VRLVQALKLPADEALALLDAWLAWARRSRLAAFVKLAQQIAAHLRGIAAALSFGLSNARTESVNTRIRLIARRAFGFHSPEALIALALLSLGGLCPPLPGRTA
jgi:transposase